VTGRIRHLVAWTDATETAGAEQSLATLVAHLPPDLRITVAGCSPAIVEAIVRGRPTAHGLVVPRLAHKADVLSAGVIRRALAALKPDVVHLNKTEVADLRYVESLIRFGGPTRVASVVHHVELPSTAPARLLTRQLAAREGPIVAVGRALARQLESILRLPSGRVTAIPNALPGLEEDRRRQERTGWADCRLIVGALARFVPHKAVDHVVAAVAAVDGVRLLLGGDGPERARLERQVHRLGIADRVDFLGWVEPERVLDRCDVLASVARIEGHPLTLLDARRRGIPIIAADVGGVGDIVDDQVNGLLVQPGDVTGLCSAVERLAVDVGLRQSMGRAARAAAIAAPSPAAMARSYLRLYWPDDEIDAPLAITSPAIAGCRWIEAQ